MIALWMLYCLGTSLLLALSALVLEHGMRLRGLPSRWAWIGALVGSASLAAVPWFTSPGAGAAVATMTATATAAARHTAVMESGPLVLPIPSSRPDMSLLPALGDLDQPLLLMWGLLSGSALALTWGAQRYLGRRRRAWRRTTLDGAPALISRDVGPAVVGILDATIVLPAWALEMEPERRRLVIAHEREHIRARDTALLAFGAVFIALMPWNVPIWWQMRRLRGAIEMDCDARVLQGGYDVGRYTTLLVEIGVRRSVSSAAFAAISVSKPLLERRIRTMLTPRPRHSAAALALSSVLALALLAVACEAPQPTVPPISPQSTAESVQPRTAEVDNRVAINRISTMPAEDGKTDRILLQVGAGPSYLLNRVAVPVPELESIIADVYAPRPRKVLFVRADAEVSDDDFAAAVEAVRAGLGEALNIATQRGFGGGSAEINVIVSRTR